MCDIYLLRKSYWDSYMQFLSISPIVYLNDWCAKTGQQRGAMNIIYKTLSVNTYLLGMVMNQTKRAREETVCPTSELLLYFQKELRPDQDEAEDQYTCMLSLSLVT